MKYLFLCVTMSICFMSCTKPALNNDPIIGIWHNTPATVTTVQNVEVDKEEWIFNDAYLGRFHGFSNNQIIFTTDFSWTIENDVYIISYPGTNLPQEHMVMETAEEGVILENTNGQQRAIRIN